MDNLTTTSGSGISHGVVWFVTFVLILAAVIDGLKLKVPNWITFPFILSGWAYSAWAFGWEGLGFSLFGTLVGLALLLPAYSIGGMGAGDVKLLAGFGAWMYSTHTCWTFAFSAVVGAVLAVLMVLWRKAFHKHATQFVSIVNEILTIRDPEQLAQIAAARKPSMMLLPYGIPIAIGAIAYFAWSGLFV